MHEIVEKNAYALIESGDLFLRESDFPMAIKCYAKALEYPLDTQSLRRVYNNLGVAYKRAGALDNAVMIFEKGIVLDASYTSFYTNLASVLKLQKRYSQAVQILGKAIVAARRLSDYLSLLELLTFLKKPKEALHVAYDMVKKFPNEYEAHLSLGNLFASYKLFENAIEPYQNAIALDPNQTKAYNNLGVIYKELGRSAEALHAYQRVLELNPSDAAAFNNLGNLQRNMGNTQRAIQCLERSIALNPNYADAYSNLGAVYKENKAFDVALSYYQKALALNPEHTNARFDVALMDLSKGDYAKGWQGYEYRLKMSELLAKTHVYRAPLWQGEPLLGKVIILQTEQGFGDNIMFIRYVPYLSALGAKVIVRTRKELVALFRSIAQIQDIVTEEEPLPEHDFYLPLLSCPHRFRTSIETIPRTFPYLFSTQKGAFSLDPKKLHVGIAWSGSPTNKGHKDRYVGLKTLRPLFDVKGVVWHSLQLGEDAREIEVLNLHETIVDQTERLSDFAQTAALIDALDLVISVDTSVAHLSGALDQKTFVLLSKPAEWRWMQEGSTTPWYDSVVLFRQEHRGDWQSAIVNVKEKVHEMAVAHSKKSIQ